jgi:hypothetical protein
MQSAYHVAESDALSDYQIIYHEISSKTPPNKIYHNDFYILMNLNEIIREIGNSYQTHGSRVRNIMKAIEVDFPRMKIFYNRGQITNIITLFTKLLPYRAVSHEMISTLYEVLIMLCTQASFYYSYKVIHEFFNDPEYNLSVIQHTDSPSVDILITNPRVIQLMFKKSYKLIDTVHKRTIYIYHTCFMMTFNLDDPAQNNALLYWLTEKI